MAVVKEFREGRDAVQDAPRGKQHISTPCLPVRLRSLRQSERTTARNPVQHKRWTYPSYRVVNTEHEQRWTRWWCATSSKHLTKVINKWGRLYWRYINVVSLPIKPCQKFELLPLLFIQSLHIKWSCNYIKLRVWNSG